MKNNRIEELSIQIFGEKLISPIEVKYKQININNLLLDGIKSARIVQLAKQKRKVDDWPIAIESTKQFFNQKNYIEGDYLYE